MKNRVLSRIGHAQQFYQIHNGLSENVHFQTVIHHLFVSFGAFFSSSIVFFSSFISFHFFRSFHFACCLFVGFHYSPYVLCFAIAIINKVNEKKMVKNNNNNETMDTNFVLCLLTILTSYCKYIHQI